MGLLTFSLNLTLDGCGLPGTRQLELLSAELLRNGVVAMHYRRAR